MSREARSARWSGFLGDEIGYSRILRQCAAPATRLALHLFDERFADQAGGAEKSPICDPVVDRLATFFRGHGSVFSHQPKMLRSIGDCDSRKSGDAGDPHWIALDRAEYAHSRSMGEGRKEAPQEIAHRIVRHFVDLAGHRFVFPAFLNSCIVAQSRK